MVPFVDALRFTSGTELKCDIIPLTNAQIKALPSAPFTLVAAPGSGRMIQPLFAEIKIDASAGLYGNVDAAAFLSLQITGHDRSSYVANDATLTPAAVDMDSLFGSASINGAWLTPLVRPDPGWWLLSEAFNGYPGDLLNAPLQLVVDNSGGGSPVDFTGGHASNSGLVTVFYLVL